MLEFDLPRFGLIERHLLLSRLVIPFQNVQLLGLRVKAKADHLEILFLEANQSCLDFDNDHRILQGHVSYDGPTRRHLPRSTDQPDGDIAIIGGKHKASGKTREADFLHHLLTFGIAQPQSRTICHSINATVR